MVQPSRPRRVFLSRFAGGTVAALLGTASGCMTDNGSDTATATVGSDDTVQPDTESPTTAPPDGPGTVQIENTTQHRIDIRIQIFVKDGPENLLEYVLVRPESASTVSYSVETTGTHHTVATLPTLGDRDVNWTVDEQWPIESTADPGTIVVRVTNDGLSIETPSAE